MCVCVCACRFCFEAARVLWSFLNTTRANGKTTRNREQSRRDCANNTSVGLYEIEFRFNSENNNAAAQSTRSIISIRTRTSTTFFFSNKSDEFLAKYSVFNVSTVLSYPLRSKCFKMKNGGNFGFDFFRTKNLWVK